MNVKCRFKKIAKFVKSKDSYKIRKQNLIESKWDKTLKFYGEGIDDDTHLVIKSLYFEKCLMRKIPTGLSEIFPNLETLSINQCGLEVITKDDLTGFKNLKALLLPNNDLTSLPSNLFEENKFVEKISCMNNKLTSIGRNMLDPLLKVSVVDLRHNFCINFRCLVPEIGQIDILNVKKLYLKNMNKKLKSLESAAAYQPYGLNNDVEKLLASDDFKDFDIKIDDNVFTVHKFLLAARSPVFSKLLQEAPDAAEIRVDEISVESFKVILNFVYDEKFPDDGDNLLEVYAAAAKMEIQQLKEFTASKLLESIDENNALTILKLAKKYESIDLKLMAFDRIKLLFPDKKLKNELADDPEAVQKLLEAKLEIEKHFEN